MLEAPFGGGGGRDQGPRGFKYQGRGGGKVRPEALGTPLFLCCPDAGREYAASKIHHQKVLGMKSGQLYQQDPVLGG